MTISKTINEVFSNEILCHFFSFLSAKNALISRRVCKIWCSCINSLQLWNHFSKRDFDLFGYKLKDFKEYWEITKIINRTVCFDMSHLPLTGGDVFYHDKATLSIQENNFEVHLIENKKN